MTKALVGRPKGENVENANRRRKQLMDAAINSIVEHGLAATTLATVAKASGLSQGTAVFYFKSKESLLSEAFQYRMELFRAHWMDALACAGPDPIERIMSLAFAQTDPKMITHQSLVLWNSLWSEASSNPSLAEASDQFDSERLDILLTLCEGAKEQISGTIWTPKTVAHAIETMTEGIWIRMYYSPDFISVKDARVALGTLLSTVFPTQTKKIMKWASDCPES